MKTRPELSALVARQLGMSERIVDDVIETFLTEAVKALLKEQDIRLKPLGCFTCKRRKYGKQYAMYVRFEKSKFVRDLSAFYRVEGPDGSDVRGPRRAPTS